MPRLQATRETLVTSDLTQANLVPRLRAVIACLEGEAKFSTSLLECGLLGPFLLRCAKMACLTSPACPRADAEAALLVLEALACLHVGGDWRHLDKWSAVYLAAASAIQACADSVSKQHRLERAVDGIQLPGPILFDAL